LVEHLKIEHIYLKFGQDQVKLIIIFFLLINKIDLDGVNDNENIYNWNMLGKRGNIVQTYPAVEYDFNPRNLQINKNDLIHIQWAGKAFLSFFIYIN
jgi:hypothetical protein